MDTNNVKTNWAKLVVLDINIFLSSCLSLATSCCVDKRSLFCCHMAHWSTSTKGLCWQYARSLSMSWPVKKSTTVVILIIPGWESLVVWVGWLYADHTWSSSTWVEEEQWERGGRNYKITFFFCTYTHFRNPLPVSHKKHWVKNIARIANAVPVTLYSRVTM